MEFNSSANYLRLSVSAHTCKVGEYPWQYIKGTLVLNAGCTCLPFRALVFSSIGFSTTVTEVWDKDKVRRITKLICLRYLATNEKFVQPSHAIVRQVSDTQKVRYWRLFFSQQFGVPLFSSVARGWYNRTIWDLSTNLISRLKITGQHLRLLKLTLLLRGCLDIHGWYSYF